MDHQPAPCPECEGTMQFRLGEYECEACGKRVPAQAHDAEDRLSTRRVSASSGAAPRTAPAREFDVQRGTRR